MGGRILSFEELDSRRCGARMRIIRTMGDGVAGACRWYKAGDMAKSGDASGVITWMGSSGDSACQPHASPNRFASGHGADLSIPQSAYRGYESAAEDCMQMDPGL